MISWLSVAVLLAATSASVAPFAALAGGPRLALAAGASEPQLAPPRASPASQASEAAAASQRSRRRARHSHLVEGALIVEEPASVLLVKRAVEQVAGASVSGGSSLAPSKSARVVYTNQFVIQVKGGEDEARKLAQKHGFVYLNHILGDYYHLEHRRLARRSTSLSQEALNISIEDEPQVLLLERQVLKRRVKRDFLELADNNNNNNNNQPPPRAGLLHAQPASGHAHPQRPNQRPAHHQFTRPANQAPALARAQHFQAAGSAVRLSGVGPTTVASGEGRTQELLEAASTSGSLLFQQASATAAAAAHKQRPQVGVAFNASSQLPAPTNESQPLASSARLHQPAPFNDPSWPLMWYLDNGAKNGFDLNVQAAWRMGYTGKGIVITILDDGLEKDHPDLQANYDPLASFDINGDDADPMPRYDVNDSNRHGTRCAGEVAAVPDNNICSIGIAYNSKVGGVRMLDGDVTDAVEARSLGLNNQHIHIYSASWGPDDNGKTVDGPGEMATRAFIDGVTNGRQGLGSIFVFASGNGGREHDNCNCDGYTNSIWTLSISSATENGNVPWYIEACSSTLATTYSSGDHKERQITTTDLHHSCTPNHTGTSASAPLAAGICALVLESNPRLTWRDMQHIVVRTAKPANLVAKDWRSNALGRNVSHAFGYGLMDAAAMIKLAKRWTTVPVQYTCEVRSPPMEKFIPAKGYIELKLKAECSNVRFLEHVQSKVTLSSSRRGDLHIYLVSPHGTRSTLLAQRPNDQAEQGFRNWPFMTVHNWGESPNGIWTLEVHNDGKPQSRAYLKEWTLILYGTNDDPNKHLDASAIAAQAAPAHNTHHHQHHHHNHAPDKKPPAPLPAGPASLAGGAPNLAPASPSSLFQAPMPALKQQVSSAHPPPPLPALSPHQQQAIDQALEAPPVGRPSNGVNTHWSYASPAPPLPAPVSKPPAPVVSSSPQPPTTSTSAYLTTFKTTVSTSSSTSSSSSSSSSTAAPTVHQQTHSFNHKPPGIRIQVGHSPHLPAQADFEVVSPPPNFAPNAQSPHKDQPALNSERPSFRPPMVQADEHIQQHSSGLNNNNSSTIQQADYNNFNQNLKPSNVNQMAPNEGGEKASRLPMKPSVSGSNELSSAGINNNDNNINNNNVPNSNHEFDANQIDSKLTKDYRSSGDQSIYSVKSNDLNSQSSGDAALKTSARQPNSSTSLNYARYLNCWPYLIITMLVMFHLTKPLVRPQVCYC